MENKTFAALQASENKDGKFNLEIINKQFDQLAEDEVLIKVHYSSLNYKDALSASGQKSITQNYPHIPGIDAAGVIESSRDDHWHTGDHVIVTGFDLGMNTGGGFGEYIAVPSKWLIRLPAGLSLKQSMIFGTAGFTAGLSVAALLNNGITPDKGHVAVTGASGGVGSIAVAILAKLGFEVIAISSKSSSKQFLLNLGAAEVIPRNEMEDKIEQMMLKPRFAAAIDTVGGQVLATVIKSLKYDGIVTACGMVNGGELPINVFPFIIRGVQLIGIDSVQYPLEKRAAVWEKLAGEWLPGNLDQLTETIGLSELPKKIEMILAGQMQGRALVKLINE